MPRGRPEKPVDTSIKEVAQLALQMRKLRHDAGLTLDQLAEGAHWSKATLQSATTGSKPPAWDVVDAWVKTCAPTANQDLWRSRHARAERAFRAHHGLEGPETEEAVAVIAAARHDGASAPPPATGTRDRPDMLEVISWHTLNPRIGLQITRLGHAPIPVRFKAAPTDLMDGPPPVDLTGLYADLPDLFSLLPQRRLVVLGEPASGKTQLVLGLGQALLGRKQETAIPVRVAVGSWRAGETRFTDWLAGELTTLAATVSGATDDYFTPDLTEFLLEQGSLLPLLDGFEEIDPQHQAPAIAQLNAYSGGIILTCRSEPFTALVESTNTTLRGSSGILLEPLGLDDLDGWLQTTDQPSRQDVVQQKWQPVLTTCRQAPDDARVRDLLAVLSSPSMVCAAWLSCSHGRADPMALLEKPSRAEMERKLIESGYLPRFAALAFMPRRRNGDLRKDAERFNASLAFFIRQRPRPGGAITLEGTGLTMRRLHRLAMGAIALLTCVCIFLIPFQTHESYYSTSGSGDGLGTAFLVICAAVGAAVAGLMRPALMHIPSAVSRPRKPADVMRGLASPAILPAVACVLCMLVVAASPATLPAAFEFLGFAVIFTVRAACTGSREPRNERTTLSGELLSAGALMSLVLLLTLIGIVAGPEHLGIQFLLSGLVLLALCLTAAPGARWVPTLAIHRQRHAFVDLPDMLVSACDQGLFARKRSAYHFADPTVAAHFTHSPLQPRPPAETQSRTSSRYLPPHPNPRHANRPGQSQDPRPAEHS
ncbi:helix-turn-helix domain-containing protein [Streptomyces sp. NPDC050636]|uniref:helix-turn-helix domain-containing protein n=1 Tax=Streptomyces sp. NPDC050636 TaxID=3154510 RepID=UPI00341608B5